MVRFVFQSKFNEEVLEIKMANYVYGKSNKQKEQMEAVHAELKVSHYYNKFSPPFLLKSSFYEFGKS